jgi:hypothetical protein
MLPLNLERLAEVGGRGLRNGGGNLGVHGIPEGTALGRG